MTRNEKFFSLAAAVLALIGVAWLATGQATLGVTFLALGVGTYAYATTEPRGPGKRMR